MLAPLVAVLLFLAAITFAFWYLRAEEREREQEAVKRDVEYAQQRMRLRLLERQEQLMRMARDVSNKDVDAHEFTRRAESLINQYPELQAITWIDERRHIEASQAAPTMAPDQQRTVGDVLRPGETEGVYSLTRDLLQPVYSQPVGGTDGNSLLQLHIPIIDQGRFAGVVMGEYSIDGLLRYGTPTEVQARYAVTLLDGDNRLLAGTPLLGREGAGSMLPWSRTGSQYEVPVAPVGNSLVFRAQAYQTSLGLIGSGLFWMVSILSALTAAMLIVTWRHTRHRLHVARHRPTKPPVSSLYQDH